MLQIHLESEFHGPNPFAPEAVIVARVQNTDGAAPPPSQLDAIRKGCQRMRKVFPGWLERIPEDVDPAMLAGQTIAHWTLGVLTELRGFLHEAGARKDGDTVRLWVPFHHATITRKALQLAATILRSAIAGPLDRAALKPQIDAVLHLGRVSHPDYQARILMEAARVADIPVLPLLRGSPIWHFGWGARSRYFVESSSNADGFIGTTLQRSKGQTKALFSRMGMPTPRGAMISKPEELAAAVNVIGWPCVLKPEDKGGGKGVTANIRSMPELEAAYKHARSFSQTPLLMESFVPGFDHRIMVLDYRVHAVSRRQPSFVTGDGTRTIAQLLAELNSRRSSNLVKSHYMRPIPTDQVLMHHLEGQGLGIDSVLAAGQVATLRSNANLSTGGMSTDFTDRIHPSTRHLAEMFARTLGLAHTGLDYMTTDIAKPWQEGGGFIEANATPGLDAMIAAGHDPVALARAVLGEKPGRIPLRVAIVPDEDVGNAVATLGAASVPHTAGWAAPGRAQVGATALSIQMPSARLALQALLINQSVEQIFAVCPIRELIGNGLLIDRADEIAVCMPDVPDAWMQMLKTRTANLTHHGGWGAFTKRGRFFAD